MFRGTFYEFQAKEALERYLYLTDLRRVGGAGDNGVDLIGKWNLSRFQKFSADGLPVDAAIDVSRHAPVLIQCKNYSSKIKPSVIRELAGSHEYHVNGSIDRMTTPTFMFLVSPLPLTKNAQAQMDTSLVPIIHVRISPMTREISGTAQDDYLVENWQMYAFGPVYMNNTARNHLAGLSVENQSFFEKKLVTS